MNELSLNILDLVENSIEAGASNIYIHVCEDINNDKLQIIIKDNGKGIPQDLLQKVFNPFFTTRKTRKIGLGLSFINQIAKDCEGNVEIKSDNGTVVEITMRYSHIDRPPLGDVAKTILSIIYLNPQIDIEFEHIINNQIFFSFSTIEVKKIFGNDLPLNLPSIFNFIKEIFENGYRNFYGGEYK